MADSKDLDEIINESGNSFHCRVANSFKEKGWNTLISPYYMDGATNKPREIDLIAERHWLPLSRMNRENGAVIFKLFIECKYIPQPNVFWFSDKDIAAATKWVTSNTPLRKKGNAYTQKHHYLASHGKVAKLFASKNKTSPENEAIYRALNQSLNAMVYLRGRESIIPEIQTGRIPWLASIEMPVILCNSFDNFYRVEMEGPTEPKPIVENFQLEVNYAYLDFHGDHKNEYFLLDVVDYKRIDDYLKVLDSDKEAIVSFL